MGPVEGSMEDGWMIGDKELQSFASNLYTVQSTESRWWVGYDEVN